MNRHYTRNKNWDLCFLYLFCPPHFFSQIVIIFFQKKIEPPFNPLRRKNKYKPLRNYWSPTLQEHTPTKKDKIGLTWGSSELFQSGGPNLHHVICDGVYSQIVRLAGDQWKPRSLSANRQIKSSFFCCFCQLH